MIRRWQLKVKATEVTEIVLRECLDSEDMTVINMYTDDGDAVAEGTIYLPDPINPSTVFGGISKALRKCNPKCRISTLWTVLIEDQY